MKSTRFTAAEDGWRVRDIELGENSVVASSGHQEKTWRTFIDLIVHDPGQEGNSRVLFTREFEKYGDLRIRYVSILGESIIVTSNNDRIESYDTNQNEQINYTKFDGLAASMTVSDGEVYVGLYKSNKVIVFNSSALTQIKTITLSGIDGGDYVCDIAVVRATLFVRTVPDREALVYSTSGVRLTPEPLTAMDKTKAWSIGVSSSGMLAVLWKPGTLITVFDMASLIEGHGGRHDALFSSTVDGCSRIRIMNSRLVTVYWSSGEVREYNVAGLFLNELLASVVSKSQLKKLVRYFTIPADQAKTIADIHVLVDHLTKAGTITPENIVELINGCSHLGLRDAVAKLTDYQKLANAEASRGQLKNKLRTVEGENSNLSDELVSTRKAIEDTRTKLEEVKQESERECEDLNAKLSKLSAELQKTQEHRDEEIRQKHALGSRIRELEESYKKQLDEGGTAISKLEKELTGLHEQLKENSAGLAESDGQIQNLMGRLKIAEDERTSSTQRMKIAEDERTSITQRMKRDVDGHKEAVAKLMGDLHQSQLERAKESKALKEVLEQTQRALDEKEKRDKETSETGVVSISTGDGRDYHAVMKDPTRAADYGRLVVGVADDLTLDNSLKLAMLFELSPAKVDLLRRVSFVETPGIKLLDFLKEQNVINMFDVTNLQKGLVCIGLSSTNERLLAPYQGTIDQQQHEHYRTEELLKWPEVGGARPTAQKDVSGTSADVDQGEGSTDDQATVEIPVEGRRYHNPYIEQMIGSLGGIINIVGVSLYIPAGALTDDQVFGVEVIQGSSLYLPGEGGRSRITPLIKLGPLGYKFNVPIQVTIPHSAVIPEPECHAVTIYTGQKSADKDTEGGITWREYNVFSSTLNHETVSFYVDCLSYMLVELVSAETEQRHAFRVVPFVDGIFKLEDDVLISTYLCKDTEEDYTLLLEGHKTRLRLGEYMTYPVRRTSAAPPLTLKLKSEDDAYRLIGEESMKIDVNHLCMVSRVHHIFRLQKNKDLFADAANVDVRLTVEQDGNVVSTVLKTKVTNLFISPKSQKYLSQITEPGPYGSLKKSIAPLLDTLHCERLSMYFELTPVENERILKDREPGRMLMKILDERELIMPNRMIGLYEGLKAIHLNKVARLILSYTETADEKISQSAPENEDQITNVAKDIVVHKPTDESLRVLLEEGFTRKDAAGALQLSSRRLDLARKLLQLKYRHQEIHCFNRRCYFPNEKYITTVGGRIHLHEGGVQLVIPPGALSSGRIVCVSIADDQHFEGPLAGRTPRLCPFVKCEPDGLDLHKPCKLIIPHCASVRNEQTGVDVYNGQIEGDRMSWEGAPAATECTMRNTHFEVISGTLGLFGLHMEERSDMRKRLRVTPFIGRITDHTDRLTISLWFYNDEDTEHKILMDEEINKAGNTQLHHHETFSLKRMKKPMYIIIRSTDLHCSLPETETKIEIDQDALWLHGRYSVDVHPRSTASTEVIALEISSLYWWTRSNHFHFKINKKVKELRQQSDFRISEPRLHQDMITAFQQLRLQLSQCIDVNTAVHLSEMMGLSTDEVSRIKHDRDPIDHLLNTLLDESLISITHLSPLETALVELGNSDGATLVQRFRSEHRIHLF